MRITDEIRRKREYECLYLGITDDQLTRLIEIDAQMDAAGFPGFYEQARQVIIDDNSGKIIYSITRQTT